MARNISQPALIVLVDSESIENNIATQQCINRGFGFEVKDDGDEKINMGDNSVLKTDNRVKSVGNEWVTKGLAAVKMFPSLKTRDIMHPMAR